MTIQTTLEKNMDDAIKIINAIGNQWKFLVVIFFFVVFFVYRKQIEKLFSQVKKVKVVGQELELEKKADLSPTNSVQAPVDDIKPVADVDKSYNGPNTFDALYLSYIDKDEDKALKIFSAMQDAETDPVKKEKNNILYLYLKYETGFDLTAIYKLQELFHSSNNEEIKAVGFYYLGLCLKKSRDFEEAKKNFENAEKLEKDPLNASNIITEISECLYEDGKKDESVKYLVEKLDEFENRSAKSNLYKAIANFYKNEGDKFLASLAYEKAIKSAPDDKSLLFDAAYQHSETAIMALCLLHYKTLISLNPAHPSALNNLGACFGTLEMNAKQIEYYKKAVKIGSNRAAGNLAIKLIDIGFHDEAKEILNEAKLDKNPESRVTAALSRISTETSDESSKEEKILEIAKIEQRLLRDFPNEFFLKESENSDLNGKWEEKDGSEINLTQNENYLEIKWQSDNKFSDVRTIKGKIVQNLIPSAKYERRNIYSYRGYDYYNGFGLLSNTNKKLHFALLKEDNSEILELVFSKQ